MERRDERRERTVDTIKGDTHDALDEAKHRVQAGGEKVKRAVEGDDMPLGDRVASHVKEAGHDSRPTTTRPSATCESSTRHLKTTSTDRLAEYARKRDFSATPEPSGAKSKRASTKKLRFVVQQHRATRLHWDFRLGSGRRDAVVGGHQRARR